MRRREFIAFASGAALWPLAVRAQQRNGRMRRVGVLASLAEDDPEMRPRLVAFREGLEILGWSEGRDVRIDYRYATGGSGEEQARAKELLALEPDVVVATNTPNTAALQRESGKIPIVFVNVSDPVGAGFIASLAQPGGNLTGLMLFEASIAGKWLSMLKEIAPDLTRAAFLANPKTTPYDYFVRAAETVAPSLEVAIMRSPVDSAADIERSIESLAQAPHSGLVLLPDTTTLFHRDLVIALAAQHRLPAVYAFSSIVGAGGLMSYSVDFVESSRQVTSYVDRILKGEKPAELPVQAPTKYETVVNLKTAKALGLTVPPSLLVRADRVVE